MTLTIDIDEQTRMRLELEASIAGKPLNDYVNDLVTHGTLPPTAKTGRRELGWAKGMIHMSDDFDEPLEEFKDYM